MANKYKLVIHFSEYTGNFHQELNAFVFGYQPKFDVHSWVRDLEKLAQTFYDSVNVDLEELSEIYDHIYDEYGPNISTLSHYVEGKGTMAITVGFVYDPAPWMLHFIERLKEFPEELAKCDKFTPKKLKIKKWELFHEVISEKKVAEGKV